MHKRRIFLQRMLRPKVLQIAANCLVLLIGIVVGYLIGGHTTGVSQTGQFKSKAKDSVNQDVGKSNTVLQEFQSTARSDDGNMATVKHQLLERTQKTPTLRTQIELLSDIASRGNEDDISIGELVRQKLLRLDIGNQEIMRIIQGFVNLDYDDIPQGLSVVDFAARIAEIASKGVLTPMPDQKNIDLPTIEFATTVNEDNIALSPKTFFSPDESKIFATFDSSQYTCDEVLVRWYNMDDRQNYLFWKYPVNRSATYNYIWLEKPEGWSRGRYSVEIYSIGDDLRQIARGKYEVW